MWGIWSSFFPDESFDGIINKGTSLFICYGHFWKYTVSNTNVVFYALIIYCCCHHFLHLRSLKPSYRNSWFIDGMMHVDMFLWFLLGITEHTLILLFLLMFLACGNDAPISAAQMLGEVSRLLLTLRLKHLVAVIYSRASFTPSILIDSFIV